MKARRYGFNNRRMTILLAQYSRDIKNLKLRNKIMLRCLPLVDAVIAKKGYFSHQDDLKQEMALKLLKALPKYKPGVSNAFAFVWTVLCNIGISKNQWLSKADLSLSTDEDAMREAETKPQQIYHSPENQHLLNSISKSLDLAFSSNGFQVPRKHLHKKALGVIRQSVASGDLFCKKSEVLRRLRGLGLKNHEIQSYIDYSLVLTRKKLLAARDNASEIRHQEAVVVLPKYTLE
jgi:hypothetical protein